MWLLLSLALGGAHALQPPGQFHGGEPVARHGERWFALTADADGARLTRTRLQVKTVVDEMLDVDGQATGQAVSSAGAGDDLVTYLRGPGLHEGPVTRAASVDSEGNDSGLPAQTLRLGTREYRIATRCEADRATANMYRCSIDLIDGERRQTLVAMSGQRDGAVVHGGVLLGSEASPHLIFAGDLDRDGRLDLIFDTTDHYNVSRPTLFLSGAAGAGELVRMVAEYHSVGC
jgi:hypothetical protein